MSRIHPTAEIEPGVEIGDGTAVWAHVHARGPSRIGRNCIVGEKTYIGPGVTIGNLVKLNAMVYVPLGVTLEDGVMIGAGTIFTNDRYPRGTDVAITELRDSGPGEHIFETLVQEGASIGAGCTIGSNLVVGRWSLVGMGSVVTRDVPPFHLVVGNPARAIAIVCRCGEPVWRFPHGAAPASDEAACPGCGSRYKVDGGGVEELDPPSSTA
ncbi:MAG: UDP-2-acetamido-3-amino-2,3-dideoxy-glucuronate N-acetyltransferase [Actinomycetota bacterium]|nr:UDP-2-acetamido-3-amino-2,3-dideoxy-glucuronate N-acetyltransferase [Actinomycetota bacterium]